MVGGWPKIGGRWGFEGGCVKDKYILKCIMIMLFLSCVFLVLLVGWRSVSAAVETAQYHASTSPNLGHCII